MTGKQVYPVSPEVAKRALLNREQYEEMYRQSVDDPDTFWGEHGKRLEWIKPYTKVKNTTYDYNNLSIKWFEDGQLNASANCLDRHLENRGDQTAIIFEGDDPADSCFGSSCDDLVAIRVEAVPAEVGMGVDEHGQLLSMG